MKKMLRLLSLLLALLMVLTAFGAMIGCGEDPVPPPAPGPEEPDGPTPPAPGPDGKATYTVSVKSIGGRAFADLRFFVYEGDALKGYGTTDANGIGTVSLVPSTGYTVELDAANLEGYNVQSRYSFVGASAAIVLTSSIITDSDLTGVTYKLGDIIRDFTVTTTDGTPFTLSEAFEDGKKAVLINFWFSTCSPCINEFPFIQSAYEQYSDDIEIIALNNYPTDNEATISAFKDQMGLSFPVAKDYTGIGNAFGINAYPTSIIVDRYGTICLIEAGSLPSERPLVAAFEHFSADNYVQKLFTNVAELTPTEKPNVEMPSSEEIGTAINGNGFAASYYPETESADAEFSWPFLIGTTPDGKSCIYPANSFKPESFATLHADVQLEAGQALAVDWFADTEKANDVLYILVNGRDIYRISGTSEDWSTCYPYVATETATYKISFIYLKDGDTDAETDRVLLSNLRTVSVNDVNTPTYIPREAATKPNANGLGFQNYVTVVFNEADGYWHVGAANGPILLVDLMAGTQLSPDTSLNDLGYAGELVDTDGDIYEKLVTYANYAINGTLYGYSPVTAELRTLLERAAEIVGFERGNANQWLQACSYYDAYGTTQQLEDPVKGVAFFAAFDTVLGTKEDPFYNAVEYDGRVIMPRGLKYKFVPARSGAYLIKSQSTDEVNGWIFDDAYEIIHTASVVDRPYGNNVIDTTNVSMLVYLEANEVYYIDIAYYDVYAAGSFTFTVEYLAESYRHFHLASPAYFTYIESTTGSINETIAGGIDVVLGEDGYYHELKADGSMGSILYADFILSTGMFSTSIESIIANNGFNFSLSESDQMVLSKLEEHNGNVESCRAYYKELWGDAYDEWAEIYKLEEVFAGKYHGGVPLTDEIVALCKQVQTKLAALSGNAEECRTHFTTLWTADGAKMTFAQSYALEQVLADEYENGVIDLTDVIESYKAYKLPTSADAPELEGCVAVDETLAQLLQALIDKYSFTGVDHAWTKLCYYYKDLGPSNP